MEKSFLIFLTLFKKFFYTAGSYQLCILYILVYTCQSQSPSSSHHHQPLLSPLGIRTFVLYICVLVDKTEDLSPGHSISDISEGRLQGGKGWAAPGYIGGFAIKTR